MIIARHAYLRSMAQNIPDNVYFELQLLSSFGIVYTWQSQ